MHRFFAPLLLLAACAVISCPAAGGATAIIWSDRPEFALYAETFNAAQEQYKVEVRYFELPARELMNAQKEYPDIVAGSWLKSATTRAFFRPVDSLLGGKVLPKSAFYPRLLAMGNIARRQYLLPVSFNAPVAVFAQDKGELLSNPFTIGFTELKKLGKAYNTESGGAYIRMGFSPAWDDNFLYITASLFNTSFREADPLAWDAAALEQAMSFIYDWTHEVNTNVQAEEDFTFKYFFEPPEKLAISGRILFTCMDSDDFFTLAGERNSSLDFRWLAEQNTMPLTEGSVYLGIAKKGKAPRAAAAFIKWFFRADTQRELLQQSKDSRLMETSFGISGGFSALRGVTEEVFPRFYQGLLGHLPPEEYLSPPNILPGNWLILKERIILPYLHDRVRAASKSEVLSLERRIAGWLRVNR
jgi:ABC-type glycerol-3-phosphate transport system substrate-binding protein